ncbi:PEP-CTERM sorting domain-containing protein [Mariniblastus fucicola]|uniref:Ice-binding protein C-terminal domain-containing protein n=1 Tax=Mariniblastus fucicola TaxID=980251 RepID=A0A5B9PCZ6_9BACT|nr:PEP-CTERM sorting domain-containing protein [Mariniblastus fucicola]QEG22782.1 hypothetical protein MFFC18_26650 [Mariniblastus fucicola]
MSRQFLFLIAALLSFGSMSASADTIIYQEDFEGGTVAGWTDGAYSDGGANADTPTRTTSIAGGLNGSANGLLLETGMFDKDSNPSWAGTQVSGPFISGAAFDGLALSDITMAFDFAVDSVAGPGQVWFELREVSGITTHSIAINPVDLAGGLNEFSLTLDNNQTGDFVTQGGFDASKDKQLYVQIREDWALNGSTRDIDLTMDNFSIVAAAVPEPSSLVILGTIGLLGLVRRRR